MFIYVSHIFGMVIKHIQKCFEKGARNYSRLALMALPIQLSSLATSLKMVKVQSKVENGKWRKTLTAAMSESLNV